MKSSYGTENEAEHGVAKIIAKSAYNHTHYHGACVAGI